MATPVKTQDNKITVYVRNGDTSKLEKLGSARRLYLPKAKSNWQMLLKMP